MRNCTNHTHFECKLGWAEMRIRADRSLRILFKGAEPSVMLRSLLATQIIDALLWQEVISSRFPFITLTPLRP